MRMIEAKDFQIGQVVKVLKGRGRERHSVILRMEDKFVWIADGDIRKFDRPKKKNRMHLESQPFICAEVAELLLQTGKVPNVKIRYGLQLWENERTKEVL